MFVCLLKTCCPLVWQLPILAAQPTLPWSEQCNFSLPCHSLLWTRVTPCYQTLLDTAERSNISYHRLPWLYPIWLSENRSRLDGYAQGDTDERPRGKWALVNTMSRLWETLKNPSLKMASIRPRNALNLGTNRVGGPFECNKMWPMQALSDQDKYKSFWWS